MQRKCIENFSIDLEWLYNIYEKNICFRENFYNGTVKLDFNIQ